MSNLGAPWNCLLIGITCVVSVLGFRSRAVIDRLVFEPRAILADKEFVRLMTSAFLHADWPHLLMNMISLYFFGNVVEMFIGPTRFLLIYFGAVLGGNLLSLFVHRHHEYRALGASGGVCGVIFAHILLLPGAGIYVFPIPFTIPAWLYAILFLAGSFYALKRAKDNVGHDAHMGGAICGLMIAAALEPSAVRENSFIFLLTLGVALALFGYLTLNPLFLPMSAFLRNRGRKAPPAEPADHRETLEMDQILDKISQQGFDKLTQAEKDFLGKMSAKYQQGGSRKHTAKPDS